VRYIRSYSRQVAHPKAGRQVGGRTRWRAAETVRQARQQYSRCNQVASMERQAERQSKAAGRGVKQAARRARRIRIQAKRQQEIRQAVQRTWQAAENGSAGRGATVRCSSGENRQQQVYAQNGRTHPAGRQAEVCGGAAVRVAGRYMSSASMWQARKAR